MSDDAFPNRYCAVLNVHDPRIERVMDHPRARTFALLVVALVEAGGPLTLAAVAARFERAGVAAAADALAALKKCRPGRPPVYRDGEQYDLDPHSSETSLLMFILGLRPPLVAPRPRPVPQPPPARDDDEPLDVDELARAWNGLSLTSMSATQVALAVVDAHRRPMTLDEIAGFVEPVARHHVMGRPQPHLGRRGSSVQVSDDGLISVREDATAALHKARRGVRARLDMLARYARPTAAEMEQHSRDFERARQVRALDLQQLRRALIHAYPAKAPRVAVVLDLEAHETHTFRVREAGAVLQPTEPGLATLLARFDVLAGQSVRAQLAGLGLDPSGWALHEIQPPQKTMQIGQPGRVLKIDNARLVQWSCRVSRPFGDPATCKRALQAGKLAQLQRRVERDAHALWLLYDYGRLHRGVRIVHGNIDEMLPAPWVARDEHGFMEMKRHVVEHGGLIEAIIDKAPSWDDPWAGSEPCTVAEGRSYYGFPRLVLMDAGGALLDDRLVLRARVTVPSAPRRLN